MGISIRVASPKLIMEEAPESLLISRGTIGGCQWFGCRAKLGIHWVNWLEHTGTQMEVALLVVCAIGDFKKDTTNIWSLMFIVIRVDQLIPDKY